MRQTYARQLITFLFVAAISCDRASPDRSHLAAGSSALEIDSTKVLPQSIANWSSRADTITGTYTLLGSIAEFWDSVVVIPDMGDHTVWRVDLNTGGRSQFGSIGYGPGEYQRVGPATKIHADSVALLPGFVGLPFPVISVSTGRGRTQSRAVANGQRSVQQMRSLVAAPLLLYGDASGNLYGAPIRSSTIPAAPQVPVVGGGNTPDSIPIVRVAVRSGRVDTLFYFSTGTVTIPTTHDADGTRVVRLDLGRYGAANSWVPTGDGRVIVADASQYRIQIRDSAANVVADWRVRRSAIPVSVERWNEYVKEVTEGSAAELQQINNKVAAGIGAAALATVPSRYIIPPMPTTLPFLNFTGGKHHMFFADGVLWVPVHAAEPPAVEQWDLIDVGSRKRLASVSLPEHQYLAQVTTLGAYVLTIDQDDLERLILYRHHK